MAIMGLVDVALIHAMSISAAMLLLEPKDSGENMHSCAEAVERETG